MKLRTSFVSNSSSTSYTLDDIYFDDYTMSKVFESLIADLADYQLENLIKYLKEVGDEAQD